MALDTNRILTRKCQSDTSIIQYVICFNDYYPITGFGTENPENYNYLKGNSVTGMLHNASIFFCQDYAINAYRRFLKNNPDCDPIYRKNVSIVPVRIVADFSGAKQIVVKERSVI